MDWLTAARHFCQLAEKGSFTQAAASAGVSQSTFSKRIAWLENHLQQTLLLRTTRSVSLTEVGLEFLPKARSLIKQFDNVLDETHQRATLPTGLLKLSAPVTVGGALLMPIINQFSEKYPTITVQLDILPFGVMRTLEHDLVLTKKYDEFDSPFHKGVPLIKYHMQMHAAPAYLAKHERVTTLAQALQHKMIITNYYKKLGVIKLAGGEYFSLKNFSFVSDHIEAILYAAKHGMGVLFVAPAFIKQELEEGTLVAVLPEIKSEKMELWAFYPKSEFIPLKSRLFIDFMKEKLRKIKFHQ
jgi:DNA-binding transcriptional LysR family regulator